MSTETKCGKPLGHSENLLVTCWRNAGHEGKCAPRFDPPTPAPEQMAREPRHTNRHDERCSQACGEGRHHECTETWETCNCTYRGLHKTAHRYATIPAQTAAGSAEDRMLCHKCQGIKCGFEQWAADNGATMCICNPHPVKGPYGIPMHEWIAGRISNECFTDDGESVSFNGKLAEDLVLEAMAAASQPAERPSRISAREFEALWSAVSKLESQVCRNPELPSAYKQIVSDAFEVLRNMRNGADPERQVSAREWLVQFVNSHRNDGFVLKWEHMEEDAMFYGFPIPALLEAFHHQAGSGAGWVSVEDRLPGEQGRDSEEVMCFLNGHCALTDFEARKGGGWGIRLGWYDAEKGMFRCGGLTREVTHWRPLPTPPQAECIICGRGASHSIHLLSEYEPHSHLFTGAQATEKQEGQCGQ